MVMKNSKRLTRDDWMQGALELLVSEGLEDVKIVPLAERLGVTSGSFYWHFKNRNELYDALLAYWERELTDAALEEAGRFEGTPLERIWFLMDRVMSAGLAAHDLAFWRWAQTDATAGKVFRRTLKKRFAYSESMFRDAGFSKTQAEIRSRMMVVYMMGESTLVSDSKKKRREQLKLKFDILTRP
jgi:AcrR family transcriptional regulator